MLLPLMAYGQPAKIYSEAVIDSLEKINLRHPKQNAAKVKLLNQLMLEYVAINPLKGIATGEQAIQISKKLGLPELLAESYQHKALNHQAIGELHTALSLTMKGLAIHDSLKNQLQIAWYNHHLGTLYHDLGDHEAELKLFEKAIILFQSINDEEGLCVTYVAMGVHHRATGPQQKALEFFEKALAIYQKSGDIDGIAHCMRRIGTIHSDREDYTQAMHFFERSLELSRTTGNYECMAKCMNNMGSIYAGYADYPKSLECYQSALEYHIRSGDKRWIFFSLGELGIAYQGIGDYQKAVDVQKQAMQLQKEFGHKRELAYTLGNIGDSYMSASDFQSALSYYKITGSDEKIGDAYAGLFENTQALDYYHRALLGYDGSGGFQCLRKMGMIYLRISETRKAFEHFQKALKISREFEKKNEIIENLVLIGNIYRDAPEHDLRDLDIELGKRYPLALKYYNEARTIAKETGSLERERDYWANVQILYEKQHDPAKAYHAFKNYIAVRDSILGEETRKQFLRREIEYEFSKKETELKYQQKLTDEQLQKQKIENRQQRKFYLLLGLTILCLAGFLATRLWYIRRDASRLKDLDKFKSKLYTNITHEFRTPLTVINGLASEIRHNPEILDSGVQTIRRNASRLLQLVNQMLDLAKLESGTLNTHLIHGDIIKYTGYLVQSFQSFAIANKIQLHFLPAVPSFFMDYDAEIYMQMLSNLISNAIKFTPTDGHVYVHIESSDSHGKEQLMIKVQDTGIGISSADQAHIFDRFYQINKGHQPEKGTGIGLSLVRELVHLFGGSITVNSSPGNGSVFTLSLPVTHNATEEESHTSLSAWKQPSSALPLAIDPDSRHKEKMVANPDLPRLLIIEDTPDVIHYLRICLERQYQISEAKDGAMGIQLALEMIPDIIITDVMMPVRDGYDVCKTLKEDLRTSHIPVIMLTARADTQSKIEGLKTGADAYLYKPFEKEELLVHLQKLLELRRRLQLHYTNGESGRYTTTEGREKEDEFIQRVKELIHQNLDDDQFGIIELCNALHLSRTQLHYKLKALTGRSASLYIRLIRLQKAKEMLSNTSMRIAEVAYATGFRDPAYFTRCFLEDFGVNPSEFRQKPGV